MALWNPDNLAQLEANYQATTAARQQAQAAANKDAIANARYGAGGVVGAVGNFGKGIVQPFGYLGNIIFQGGKEATGALTGRRDWVNQAQDNLSREASYRRVLANGAQALLTVAGGGAGKAVQGAMATRLATAGAPKLITSLAPSLVSNAMIGAGYGGAAAASGQQFDPNDVLKQAAVGGLVGGAVGGAGQAISRFAPKKATPIVVSGAKQTPVKPIAPPKPLPVVRGSDVPMPPRPTFNPLAEASDADLMVRNHINNLQFQQGAGANLPAQALPGSASSLTPNAKAGLVAKARGQSLSVVNPGEAPKLIDNGLPAGFSMTKSGDVVMPNGSLMANPNDLQVYRQAPKMPGQLARAVAEGDVAKIQKIYADNIGNSGYVSKYLRDNPNAASKSAMEWIANQKSGAVAPSALAPEAAPVANAAAPAGAATGRGNLLQRAGNRILRSTTGIYSPSSPFGAQREQELFDFMRGNNSLGVNLQKGSTSASKMYNKLPAVMKQYSAKVKAALASDTTKVDSKDLISKISNAIDETDRFTGSPLTTREGIKRDIAAVINRRAKSGSITATDLAGLKSDLQSKLDRAFTKLKAGQPTTGNEDMLLAARDTLDDLLPQSVRTLGKEQSKIYDLATMLDRSRRQGTQLPSLIRAVFPQPRGGSQAMTSFVQHNTTALGNTVKGVGDVFAKGGEGLVSAAKGIAPTAGEIASNPLIAGLTPQLSGLAANQYLQSREGGVGQGLPPVIDGIDNPYHTQEELAAAAERYAQDPTAPEFLNVDPALFGYPADVAPMGGNGFEQASAGMGGGMDGGMGGGFGGSEPAQQGGFDPTGGTGITSDMVVQAINQDLMQTGGKNGAELARLYNILYQREQYAAQQSRGKSLSSSTVNQIHTTQQALNGIQSIADAFANTTQTGKGIFSKVLASRPLGDWSGGIPGGSGVRDVNVAITTAIPDIAKALGYGTTSAELKAVMQMLPNSSDTQKSAQVKLSKLQNQINEYARQYLSTESAYVQPDNATLSGLASGGIPFDMSQQQSYGYGG